MLAASPAGDVTAAGAPFRPDAGTDLPALERLMAATAPDVEAARLDLDLARADLRQSRLLPNPSLDVGWGTIPVGPLNPPDLGRPLARVPNYAVGVSYTIPVGKRRPAIARARELEAAAEARVRLAVRALSLRLASLLGELAVVTLRSEGIRNSLEDAERAVHVAESRLASGFGSPLDVDRLRIELSRSEQLLRSAESDATALIAACAGLVAHPCEGFRDSGEARRFLVAWLGTRETTREALARRPDLEALAAEARAARAEERLGRAARLPDPTIRLGYLHDRFLASGAQMNSLNVSVGFPLPLFDRGQALVDAARARQARYAAERQRRIVASEARITALSRRVEAQRARQRVLSEELLPRAQAVLDTLEKAAETRLVSLADVIQARRTMSELLIEEADSYADAFSASIALIAEQPPEGRSPE